MLSTSQPGTIAEFAAKPFGDRVAESTAAVPAISPQAARNQRERNTDTLFVDPRDATGIATTGMIPDALNLTLDTLSNATDTELLDELASYSRPIIAACQGGPMGAIAAYTLKQRGFTNVQYVDGGTQGWLDAGYPTNS